MTLVRILCLLALALLSCQSEPEDTSPIEIPTEEPIPTTPVETLKNPVTVLKVIDGDTIEVDYEGTLERVRFQGVNAPEMHPTPEPLAVSAKEFTLQESQDQVELSFDSHCGGSAESCRDVYGRILAYVRLKNGKDLGEELLRLGLARLYIFKGQAFDKITDYKTYENQAKQAQLGVWMHSSETLSFKSKVSKNQQ